MNDSERVFADSAGQDDSAQLAAEQARIMSRIRKDSARVSRLRVMTIVLWTVLLVGYLVVISQADGNISSSKAMVLGFLFIVLVLMLIVAVVCTVSLYIRWRSLGQRQLMATLAGIQKALEDLNTKLKER